MTYLPLARTKLLGAFGLLLAALLVATAVDARARRARHEPLAAMSRAVVRTLGTPDLALSSSSRWLRHPSQSEPGAPFADAPATLDVDPGSAVVGPPLELLRVGARDPVIRRARGSR